MNEKAVKIEDSRDVVRARHEGREMARKLGFGPADQARLATAISELTRNVIQYAGKGVCVITDASEMGIAKIRVRVEDHGPGIADIDQAIEPGFSTGNGLGAGLPGTRRLVHEFRIDSKPGHTVVSIAIVRRRA